jgi:hypothetical protein
MRRSRGTALVLAGVFVLMGVACSGGGDDESAAGESSDMRSADGLLEEREGGGGENVAMGSTDDMGSSAAPADRSAMEIPSIGPSVIKTADLDLEVEHDGFQDAFQAVVNISQAKGGFVLSSQTSGNESRSGSITVRIPEENFESALSQINELGDITDKRVSGEDVSQEFIDLDARLRNLTAQEAVMLDLMGEANTIQGTIRVQNQLTGIQLEIERIRGRLRYLQDQTALSTITVDMTETGVVAPKEAGTIERAWDVARETTGAIVSGVLIGGAALVPIAIVLLVVLLIAKWVWPKLGRVTGS